MTDLFLPLVLAVAAVNAAILAMRARERREHDRRLAARMQESKHLAAAVRATLAQRRHFA
jgi:hypothetical protein